MLQITYVNGKYEIKGDLVSENTQSFRAYFKTLLQYDNKVILNLKSLRKIDTSGIQMFKDLCKLARANNRKFRILKKVNKKVAWILKDPKFLELIQ